MADETIHYTADTVLIADGTHVLLIRRRWSPYKGYWALPGGHVDAGEESWETAYRELHEETGLELAPGTLRHVGVYDTPDRDPRGRYVTAAYATRIDGMPAATAADDAMDAEWVPVADALANDMQLAFDHKQIIRDALRRTAPAAVHEAGTDVWDIVDELVAWLDASDATTVTPEVSRILRCYKITEEAGEVAAAVIGATGQNPRKGVTHDWNDVARELCDVILAAKVALATIDPGARAAFAKHVQHVADRAAASSA